MFYDISEKLRTWLNHAISLFNSFPGEPNKVDRPNGLSYKPLLLKDIDPVA